MVGVSWVAACPWVLESRGMEREFPVPRAMEAMLSDSRADTVQASMSTVAVEALDRVCWWIA